MDEVLIYAESRVKIKLKNYCAYFHRNIVIFADPIILLGFLSHTVAYYCVFINLPDLSPLNPTDQVIFVAFHILFSPSQCLRTHYVFTLVKLI